MSSWSGTVTLRTPNLTRAYDPATEDRISSTYPGMAGWAGSGPEHRTCRECLFWSCRWKYRDTRGWFEEVEGDQPLKASSFKRDPAGILEPRSCRKFWRMNNGVKGPRVPHYAMSCNQFTPNPNFPTVYRPEKVKKPKQPRRRKKEVAS